MSKDTSGPAFPPSSFLSKQAMAVLDHVRDDKREEVAETIGAALSGLTKREYFAGLAMQGTIASQTPDESIDPAMCARWCFEVADAMIAEGSK